MAEKRRFGRVRKLPSGRWQARYKGPDGIDRAAPHTFGSKTSAERWLTLTEAEIIQGDWIDPAAGRVLFGSYARDWIEERPACGPRRSSCTGTCCAPSCPAIQRPGSGGHQGTARAAMAEEPARRAGQRGHRGQGVPAAQSDLQHRGR